MEKSMIERVSRALAAVGGSDPDQLTEALPDGPCDFPIWRCYEPEAIAAIEAMREWQPIDSAPKDGTRIVAYGSAYPELASKGSWFTADPNRPRVPYTMLIHWVEAWYDKEIDNGDGTYRKEPTQGYAYWGPERRAFQPTHWMPLPAAPAPSQKGLEHG